MQYTFSGLSKFVFINLRTDYPAVRVAIKNVITSKQNSSDAEQQKKAVEATSILRNINTWEFCLLLSGCGDVYDHYGKFANACQKVNVLPHERYDTAVSIIEKFSTMVKCMNHVDCPVSKCLWPRYHEDLGHMEKDNLYMGTTIDYLNTGHVRQTRLQNANTGNVTIADGIALVRERLNTLAWRLHHDLSREVFDEDVKEAIEHIRTVSDLKGMLSNVEKKGSMLFGMESSDNFLKSARALTNTITTIPDHEIISAYKSFLCKLEAYGFQGTAEDPVTSMNIIKTILVNETFCTGVEVIVHIICSAAVKISVESVVESLVSRYEKHFHSSRQMDEDHALQEMSIAENGPLLHQADPILRRNKYQA